MLDFDCCITTKIFFGRNKIQSLVPEIKACARKLLLVYGGGSIKKNGIYQQTTSLLEKGGFMYKELPGVQPNPRITSVRKGIALCRAHGLEFILAVGGGSVIDCAKAIAAGVFYDKDPWDFFLRKVAVEKALPLATVLTIAATGSEMNGYSVVSNEETQDKLGIGSDLLRPKFSILDPSYTFSLPRQQSAAGVVDIFSHILEQYFCAEPEAYLQDRLAEGLLKTCIEYGPRILENPQDYEARAQVMWASSLALNGLLEYGKTGDWATHCIEHSLSALYDITHGIGLALITPAWMRYVLNRGRLRKFVDYSRNVWGLEADQDLYLAEAAIEKTRSFFTSLGMPQSLHQLGVEEQSLTAMAQKTTQFGAVGNYYKLNTEDVLNILKEVL